MPGITISDHTTSLRQRSGKEEIAIKYDPFVMGQGDDWSEVTSEDRWTNESQSRLPRSQQ